jgi:serine/threonine protein kinase
MITFSCPHCGAQLRVRDSLAGTTAPCPACSQAVQAPVAESTPADSLVSLGQKGAARDSSPPTVRMTGPSEDTTPPVPKRAPPREYPFLAPPSQPNALGSLGPYRVLRVLGTGAMGIVFEAEDTQLQRLVALKVMKPSLAAHAEFHQRFLREARLAAAIDHDHLVTVYQVGQDRGIPYLAMKLLRGETLEVRLRRLKAPLPVADVLRIGREVAEGLAAAHARGLLHRDIKPANIWLEERGEGESALPPRVKILDFGLARGTDRDVRFTTAGTVIGTPSYMAPEQAEGVELDARCDLYSLGAVLYQACTGRRPFEGEDTLTVLAALATKDPEPPHKVVPAVPRPVSDLVMSLLAKDPNKRPQAAQAVVTAIEALQRDGTADEIPPPPAPEPPPPPEPKTQKPAPPPPAPVGVKKKAEAKKAPRPAARKRKSSADQTDWGRLVFLAALVLLAISAFILLLGIIRHVRRNRAAEANVPVRVAWVKEGRKANLSRR